MSTSTKLWAACALSMSIAGAYAAPVLFQGSSNPTVTSPLTVAQARTAWQAALVSSSNDPLTGSTGPAPFTSAAGNTYTQTGNGSTIRATGSDIEGLRNSAPLIQFDITFPSFVNAVGFDVFDNDGGGMDLLLTDAFSGIITTFNFLSVPGSNRTEFFGVVFDPSTFISRLRVSGTDPGGVTAWDNFTTGVGRNVVVNPNNPNNQVPVPGSLLLVGLGLAALATQRKARAVAKS